MTQSEIKDFKNLLKTTYLPAYQDINATELADKILDDDKTLKIGHRTIRGYIAALRKEEELDKDAQDDESLTDVPEYIVTEEEVVEESGGAESEIDRSLLVMDDPSIIDLIFCAYSRKGLNLTGPIIQSIFNLTHKEFQHIVSVNGLNKESDPYSATAANTMTSQQLHDYVSVLVSEVMNAYGQNESSVTAQLHKEYKKEIVSLRNKALKDQQVLEAIAENLKDVSITPMKAKYTVDPDLHVNLVIPDMHIGLVQENYNNDIVRDKLSEILHLVQDVGAKVTVSFMGDIIHTVTGLNHMDNWKSIDPTQTGANAITTPFEILVDFLSAIPELERVNIVGGE